MLSPVSDPQPNGQPPSPPPPGVIPPGFTSADAMAAMAEDQARQAMRQQGDRDQQIHDGLEAMLREDPALLLQKLPDLFGQAVSAMVAAGVTAAVQQILQSLGGLPVKATGRACAECLRLQIEWRGRHLPDLEAAKQRAMASIGASDPHDPRLAQVEIVTFLPENLRPGAAIDGLPVALDPVTTVNGTEVCPVHHPAAGSKLIAASGIGIASLLAMARQPGMGQFAMAGMPAA